MNLKISLCASIIALLAGHVLAAPSSDEMKKRNIFNSFQSDWNAPGFPGLENLLTPSVDFVVVTGKWLKGRDEVVSYHRQLLKTFYAGSHLMLDDVSVRLVDPDHAVAHIAGAVDYTQKGETVHRSSLATATLVKTGDG